ncbi:MAG: hypothetical protein ACXVIM_08635 [Acidimicrobiia bacterium]
MVLAALFVVWVGFCAVSLFGAALGSYYYPQTSAARAWLAASITIIVLEVAGLVWAITVGTRRVTRRPDLPLLVLVAAVFPINLVLLVGVFGPPVI